VIRTFRRHGDRIRMQLEPIEVDLLRTTRDGVRAALAGGDTSDPIVQRLFPRALAGDDEADAELRRLLHDDLLASRLAGLDALIDLLDRGRPHRGVLRVDLEGDEPLLVLGVLNDLRLAIGARVGISDLDRNTLDEDDPVTYRLAVMDHLAGMQEQLLAILDPPSVSVHEDLRPEDLE
jgi:hypothetical protein